jgi:hypothetical protein
VYAPISRVSSPSSAIAATARKLLRFNGADLLDEHLRDVHDRFPGKGLPQSYTNCEEMVPLHGRSSRKTFLASAAATTIGKLVPSPGSPQSITPPNYSPHDFAAINRDNALALFPRLAFTGGRSTS